MKKAFSLVELSIVLVILGLLAGGILSGQALIHAAELRTALNDFQNFSGAVYQFRDKYNALPGDMDNAVQFWGAAAGGTANGIDDSCAALTTPSTGTATCNGNGNGQIAEETLVTSGDRLQFYEAYRFWQHLANAGFIEGHYDGVSYNGRTQYVQVAQGNAPRSKLGSTGSWGVQHVIPNYSYPGYWFNNAWGTNTLRLGIGSQASGPIVKPEDAWNLDTKIDDGKPGTGVLLSYESALNPHCIMADTETTDYNLADSGIDCSFVYKLK